MHIHLVEAAFGGVDRLLSSFLSVMKTQEEVDGGKGGEGAVNGQRFYEFVFQTTSKCFPGLMRAELKL